MLGWVQRFFVGSDAHFDPDPARRQMGTARVRVYRPDDYATCRELYVLNEPGRFPAGVLPDFEMTLRSRSVLFLVAEKDGVICGCGGIAILPRCHASLFYGLIHPQKQRQGFGTLLLLARLALLPEDNWRAILAAVPASRTFYERFGFRVLEGAKVKLKSGVELPYHSALVSPDSVGQCASLLARAGVEILATTADIP